MIADTELILQRIEPQFHRMVVLVKLTYRTIDVDYVVERIQLGLGKIECLKYFDALEEAKAFYAELGDIA